MKIKALKARKMELFGAVFKVRTESTEKRGILEDSCTESTEKREIFDDYGTENAGSEVFLFEK